MASWGGEFHYPRFQTSINDGGHGNRLFGALQTLHKRITPVYERLRTVIIENLDWQTCFDRYDRPGTVMYIDPPYPENGCNYVHNMRDRSDHEKLAHRLNHAQCRWLLSSYDTPFIRELFAEHRIIPVQSSSGMNTEKNGNTRVVNKEVLIMNYAHPNDANVASAQPIQQNILLDVQAAAE